MKNNSFIKKIKPNIEIIITDRIRDNDFLISYYSQALKWDAVSICN